MCSERDFKRPRHFLRERHSNRIAVGLARGVNSPAGALRFNRIELPILLGTIRPLQFDLLDRASLGHIKSKSRIEVGSIRREAQKQPRLDREIRLDFSDVEYQPERLLQKSERA